MVIDTGIGIPKERLASIFNLFEHNQNNPLMESFKNKTCKNLIVYHILAAGLGLTIS